jgi:membrane protease YdiL (CAAX protease family)
MAAPTGVLFVIGSVFLLALYPTRPYWLYLGLYQWGLGGLMLGALAMGIGWAEWGFTVYDLLQADIYRGTSLGLPLVFAWLEARAERAESQSPPNS